MKILITGSSGLLGSTVTNYLKKEHELILVSATRSESSLRHCDLSDLSQTRELLKATQPDFVIHLSGLTNVDECDKQPERAFKLNALTCKNLNSAIKIENLKTKVIFISTDNLYNTRSPSKEDQILPQNVYSFTKLLGESYLAEGLVLRTNFIGPSQSKHKKSFSDWVIESLKNNKEVTLFTDSYLSPLSMTKLSELLSHCILNYETGVYNLGSQGAMSRYEIGLFLAKELKLNASLLKEIKVKEANLTAKRPISMSMDSSLFEKTFNINLPTMEETLRDCVEEYLEIYKKQNNQ